MTGAKAYLLEIQREEAKIRQKRDEIIRIRETATCIPSTLQEGDRVQTSASNGARYEKMIARAVDLEKEIIEEAERLNRMRHERIRKIQQMDDPRLSDILYQRYIMGKNLTYIAGYIGSSYERTRHLHGEALREFEKIYLDGK